MELLRHRCRLIFCVDATGDTPPLARTLAQAIAIAREELGVSIELSGRSTWWRARPRRWGTPRR